MHKSPEDLTLFDAYQIYFSRIREMMGVLGVPLFESQIWGLPEWWKNLTLSLFSPVRKLLVANEDAEKASEPYTKGVGLGLFLSLLESIIEILSSDIEREEDKRDIRRIRRDLEQRSDELRDSRGVKIRIEGDDDVQALIEFLTRIKDELMNQVKETVKGIDSEADLYGGLSSGIRASRQGPMNLPGYTETLSVKFGVWLFWPEVEQFTRYSDIHDYLSKLYTSGVIGDKERIRKILNRIGIHKRVMGRPRKVKKSDK